MRSFLSGQMVIHVKDDADRTARLAGELRQLSGCQLGSDGARRVPEAGLPQYR